jgi:cytidyltransferase-like protein
VKKRESPVRAPGPQTQHAGQDSSPKAYRTENNHLKSMKKTVGVYWGRFNPPHKGHIALVRRLVTKVDLLTIAVGSAESKNTKRNPFSGDERVEMLKSYLREQDVKVKDFIAVKDGDSWASSIDSLLEKCGKFDVLRARSRLKYNRILLSSERFERKNESTFPKQDNALPADCLLSGWSLRMVHRILHLSSS